MRKRAKTDSTRVYCICHLCWIRCCLSRALWLSRPTQSLCSSAVLISQCKSIRAIADSTEPHTRSSQGLAKLHQFIMHVDLDDLPAITQAHVIVLYAVGYVLYCRLMLILLRRLLCIMVQTGVLM